MQAQILRQDAITSPFWQYDRKLGRYRDKSTGRFLSQANLEKLQRRHIALIERDMSQVGELLLRGQINLRTFQEAIATSIKTLHLHQHVLAKGGIKQMSAADWLEAGREIRNQYTYLKGFAEDINRGYSVNAKGEQVEMSINRFKVRLSLYAKAGRVSHEQGRQSVARSQGRYFMRRRLGATSRHCGDCIRYAAMGVQPVGMLPLPAQRCVCGGRCDCTVQFYSTLEAAIGSNQGYSVLGSSPGQAQKTARSM